MKHHMVGSCAFKIDNAFLAYILSNKGSGREPIEKIKVDDGLFRFLILCHAIIPTESSSTTRMIILSDLIFDERSKADRSFEKFKEGHKPFPYDL